MSITKRKGGVVVDRARKGITTRKLVMASFLTALSIVFTRFLYFMIPLGGLPAIRLSFGESPLMLSGILFGPLVGGLSGLAADLIGVVVNPQGAYFPGFTLSSILWGAIPGLISNFFKKNKIEKDYSIVNSIIIFLLVLGMIGVFFEEKLLSINEGKLYLYEEPVSLLISIIFIIVFGALIFLPIFLRGKESGNKFFSFDKVVFMVSISYIIISLGLNTYWLSIIFKKGFLVLFPGRLLSSLACIPIHSMLISTLLRYTKYAMNE